MAKKQDSVAVWRDLEAKTRDLSAWVVLKDGELVAKLITHYGGRSSPNGLTVKGFVHILGLPCARGIARGGGYDMRTAALSAACQRLDYLDDERSDLDINRHVNVFRTLKDQGYEIPRQLRELGYTVEQVF